MFVSKRTAQEATQDNTSFWRNRKSVVRPTGNSRNISHLQVLDDNSSFRFALGNFLRFLIVRVYDYYIAISTNLLLWNWSGLKQGIHLILKMRCREIVGFSILLRIINCKSLTTTSRTTTLRCGCVIAENLIIDPHTNTHTLNYNIFIFAETNTFVRCPKIKIQMRKSGKFDFMLMCFTFFFNEKPTF